MFSDKGLIPILSLIILFAACSKDDVEQDADYNGTWAVTYSIPTSTGYIQSTYKIELSNSSYTESFPTYYTSSGVYHYNVWEGKVVKKSGALQFEVTKMKTYNYNPTTGEVLELISETTPTLPHTQTYMSLSWNTASYAVSGENLTFSVDWNEDGDCDDANEIVTYTRISE